MATKNTQVRAKNLRGDEVQLSHSQSDSPILDVQALEKLQQFRPDLVDFVKEQTQKEAQWRRENESRIVWFTFIERIGGILLASAVCAFGVFGSIWAADHGHEKLAMTIAAVCIGTLAVAYLKRR